MSAVKSSADGNRAGKDARRISPTRRRQEEKRQRDRAEFGRQLENGSLVIRQMTPEERAANPPRDTPPKRRSAR